MLFFVTGALGLRLLYKSPAFTKTGKILLAIIVLIYTAIVLILFAAALVWMWRFFMQQLSAIQ